MIKVTDTLSSMVMAAPLTVAASSAISDDTSVRPFDMHDNAKLVSSRMQWHAGQQWRLPDQVRKSGNQAPISTEWYGARQYSTGRFHGIADLGVTPSMPRMDDSRTFYVEEGKGAHRQNVLYNTAWHRQSAAYAFGNYTEVRYVTRTGVDVGLKLQYGSTAGRRYPDNAVRFSAPSAHEATWAWTQTA